MSIRRRDADTHVADARGADGSALQLTVGDVYRGDSLGALMPSAVEAEARQIGTSFVVTECGDEDNDAWIQSSETMEIRQ